MRALIVEDETTPRELLRDFVPWSRLGFEEVETAKNGIEALEILGKTEIDLVITDVRMPKMDGIALALEIRQRWPEVVLVFLSGFSDKEYLMTAIRVQALDYLDKPIDIPQVESVIAHAAETIRQRLKSRAESERGEELIKGLSPLRRQAIAQILLGFAEDSGSLSIEDRFIAPPLRVLLIQPRNPEHLSPTWESSLLNQINGENSPLPSFVAAPSPDRLIALVCDSLLASDPASFNRSVESLLSLIRSLQPGTEVSIGFSLPAGSREELPLALTQARNALTEAFYKPSDLIYAYHNLQGRSLEFRDSDIQSLNSAMERGEGEAVLTILALLEQKSLACRDNDLGRVRDVWLGAAKTFLEWVPGWELSERTIRADKLRAELDKAADLASVAKAVRDCYDRLFRKPSSDLHLEDRMEKAKAYIKLKFADPDLTVDDIAAFAGFSESYFCSIFKQEEGSTVKDFVTRYRIERAKAYLREKDSPLLADLALKVGFRDPNYFGTVFKRITGTTPGAYRHKALG